MKIFRKIRTFLFIFRRNPGHALELAQLRAEAKLGFSLHFLSPLRAKTAAFERRNTRAVHSQLTTYGNYYLDAERLGGTPTVFSAGVGQAISFDEALLKRHDVRLCLFDPTPSSKRFIEQAKLPENVTFDALAISDYDGEIELFVDDIETDFAQTASLSLNNPGMIDRGFKVPCRRIKTLMAERGIEQLDVLKLDIEGAAIRVLRDTFASGITPTQIAAEFERPGRRRDVDLYLAELEALFAEMRRLGYTVYRTRPDCKGCQVEILAVRTGEIARVPPASSGCVTPARAE